MSNEPITDMRRGAVISSDGLYRYSLTRIWGPLMDPDPKVMLFVMLNPSTADADIDDPTIRRCIAFARREGATALQVVNLFAYRATNPADLLKVADPVGPANNDYILYAADAATWVVCGWGAQPIAQGRARIVTEGLRRRLATNPDIPNIGWSLRCLGTTASGAPRHPLYIKGAQPLEIYPGGLA